MAQLDKFIEKVQAGQEIMLEAGKAPVLKAESGSVPMTNQALTAAQITALVLELAPAELRDAVIQGRPAKFDYAAGIKTVIVVFSPEAEPLTARIYSGVRRSDTAFAAPQPSAAAPHAPEPGMNVLLRRMFKLGASDLHLTSSHRPMVRVNGAVSNLIREGKIFQIPSIMQTGKKAGMTMLNDVLFKLVTDKLVEPEEAYMKAVDKPAFVALLKSKSIQLKLAGIEE